jgi:hypothetical protein
MYPWRNSEWVRVFDVLGLSSQAIPRLSPAGEKYAVRFIAVLTLAAACCASLVGSVIWIISEL